MNKENIKYSVGLDIGTTKIVVVVGKKNENNKIEIIGVGRSISLGVHRGVVNNITQTINSIKEAVFEAEKSAGIKIKNVIVGIAGQHIRSIQHSDYITRNNFEEVIDESDIEKLINQVHKLVMMPGEEILHVLPQEFKVDGQNEIYEPIGMYGNRLEANFHVVVGQIASIKNIGRCVKDAGLQLEGITLEPIASSEAVLNKEEKEAGVAIIDIGGGTTDIAIFKDNIIRHTSVIPFGGNVITEDIKTGCSIIQKQAEILKTKFGSAWPGENKETEIVSIPGLRGREPKEITLKKLSQIIHARVKEILEQCYSELKNYGLEDHKKKLIAGIVLTGGGANLKHIRQLTEYITGMDVRIGYSNENLSGNKSEELSSPEYATAIGLLMKGFENNTNNTYFIDEKEPENKVNDFESILQPAKEDFISNITEENSIGIKTSNPTYASEIETKKKRFSFLKDWSDKFIEIFNQTE